MCSFTVRKNDSFADPYPFADPYELRAFCFLHSDCVEIVGIELIDEILMMEKNKVTGKTVKSWFEDKRLVWWNVGILVPLK